MYFYCSKGNVGNMAVTRKRFHCQRANMCHVVPYSENHKLQNSPWGEGVYGQPKVYTKLFRK